MGGVGIDTTPRLWYQPGMNQTRDIPSQGHDSLRFQPERLHFARDADR
jgi:hypothetical protein